MQPSDTFLLHVLCVYGWRETKKENEADYIQHLGVVLMVVLIQLQSVT